MAVDALFTNGIIAAREKYLLKDKIVRMCEVSADEAFRMLTESGFGGSEAVASVYGYEKLVTADSRAIDSFIREYSPSNAQSAYLLSARDFHNAKALVKAEYLGTDAGPMLAPDGLIPAEEMQGCFRSGDFSALNGELGEAVKKAREYVAEGEPSGAVLGIIFDRALYKYLSKACAKNRLLKKFIADKADMINILTAMRSNDIGQAKEYFVEGGNIHEDKLEKLFSGEDAAQKAFRGSGMEDFVKLCFSAKNASKPMTAAERLLASYETDALAKNKYGLKADQPFLYYIFRRRAENENVRIVFVCLLSGMQEREIKGRLRGMQEKV